VRNTALAEICCSLSVSIKTGALKKISVELPMIVCNGASINPPKQIDVSTNNHPSKYDLVREFDVFGSYCGEYATALEPVISSPSQTSPSRVLPWTESGATIHAPETYYEKAPVKASETNEPSHAVADVNFSAAPDLSLRVVQGAYLFF
jgi:hypothetical protein